MKEKKLSIVLLVSFFIAVVYQSCEIDGENAGAASTDADAKVDNDDHARLQNDPDQKKQKSEDAGISTDASPSMEKDGGCTPITECPKGYECGEIDDGCGGTISCGVCKAQAREPECIDDGTLREYYDIATCLDYKCQYGYVDRECSYLCIDGACQPCPRRTCADYPDRCGAALPDGCGGTIDCSTNCAPGWVCYEGSCCLPKTCDDYPGNCGASLDDGCGGTIDCSKNCPKTPKHLFSKAFESTGGYDDRAHFLALDPARNVYVAGNFESGTLDSGGGPLRNSRTRKQEIFLVKYSPEGKHLWSKRFGGIDDDEVKAIAVDGSGNVYIAGYFYSDSIDFGGGELLNATAGTKSQSADIFIAKFNPHGNHLWSKRFGGNHYDTISSVAVDGHGNIYIAGYFYSRIINFGGEDLKNGGGRSDIFMAKLDPQGNHLWSKDFGGKKDDKLNLMNVDSEGNIVLVGQFQGDSISFGDKELKKENDEYTAKFIAKFDSEGNHLWSKKIDRSVTISSIAFDVSGSFLIAGEFSGSSLDLGGGDLENNGINNAFLAKFDADGNHIWSTSFGGEDCDGILHLSHDKHGNIYATGYFRSPDFPIGNREFHRLGHNICEGNFYCADTFIAKFDENGDFLWAKNLNGDYDDFGKAIAIDDDGAVYVAGHFQSSTLALGNIQLENSDHVIRTHDGFLLKLHPDGSYAWTKVLGGDGGRTDWPGAMAIAKDGSLFIAGSSYSDTIDFGSGPLMGAAAFVARFDSTGKNVWAKNFLGDSSIDPLDMAVDNSGNIVLAGSFSASSVDFGGGRLENETDHFVPDGKDAFLVKFDPGGRHLWSKSFGSRHDNEAKSVIIDHYNNIYVGGNFNHFEIDIDGEVLQNLGDSDIFVAKFDPFGSLVWAQSLGEERRDRLNSMALDPHGNLIIAAQINGVLKNFQGEGIDENTYYYISIIALDADGNHLWVKGFSSGSSKGEPSDLVIDPQGNIYVTGVFLGSTIDLGGETLKNKNNVKYQKTKDIFLLKLDPAGNHVWSKSFGGVNDDIVNSIALDSDGNIYIAGYYRSPTLEFGEGILTNEGGFFYEDPCADIFIAKFDSDGNYVWSMDFGKGGFDDFGDAILIDPDLNLFLTGSFRSPAIDFNGPPLKNNGFEKIYLVKLGQ